MNDYLQFKGKIQQKVDTLEETIRELERLRLVQEPSVFLWREHLSQVKASLQGSLLRVAVVGSVKSGKSTLINTLIGKDLLKRGAGIITAFITRIRTDGDPGGWVELKSWPQIQDELNSTLKLLPLFVEELEGNKPLDIRRPEDRDRIKLWLDTMSKDGQQAGGRLDPSFLFLTGYLDGYNKLNPVIGENVNRLIFDEHSLVQHQQYAGHEGQAVYLRDMELHCPVPWLGDRVELADCQGSDSPNPLHYARLQQYLLKSHFILYVISSRTGLREADFKLLDFIKSLQMFPQTFFILNIDLDEHPHLDDLERIVERVRKELGWIVPNPQLFAFSSLYHLIDQLGDAGSVREKRQLSLWREEPAFAALSDAGFGAFRDEMSRRITGQRSRVLLGSGLNRLSMVAAGIMDTVNTQKGFMDSSLGNLKQSAGQLEKKYKSLEGALLALKNAIAGLKDSLERELDKAVARYFHPEHGAIVIETLDMVEHYPISRQCRKELTDLRQLLLSLHEFYLEFRYSLSRFLVEEVNLRVIEFAKSREAFLRDKLTSSSLAFWALFASALDDYRRETALFHMDLKAASDIRDCEWPSLTTIPPPTFSAFVDRDAAGRGILLIKFGLGRFSRFLSGLRSRTGKAKDYLMREKQDQETIEEAVRLVKSITKKELIRAFKSYRESFKSDYLYRIIEEGTCRLLDEFKTRAEMARLDFENLLKQSEMEGEGRQAAIETLIQTSRVTRAMVEELDSLRCAVNLEWLPTREAANREARAQLE